MNFVPKSATERVRRFGIWLRDKINRIYTRPLNPAKTWLILTVVFLTKNMQTADLKHERFLRGRIQMIAHFFEAANSLQDLSDIELRGNFCRRFRAAFE